MSFLNDIVNIGSFGLVPDITGEDTAKDAANQIQAGGRRAQDELARQFDLTREDLMPFLEAAIGSGSPGALSQYQQGIGQGPNAPTLSGYGQFSGPAEGTTGDTTIQDFFNQFQFDPGSEYSDRSLSRFNFRPDSRYSDIGLNRFDKEFSFDPEAALDNPALAFQREQGERQLDRLAARNRTLGSGNRLLDAVRFGQGLTSEYLDDEYSRQLGQYTTNRNTNTLNNQVGLQNRQSQANEFMRQLQTNQAGNQVALQNRAEMMNAFNRALQGYNANQQGTQLNNQAAMQRSALQNDLYNRQLRSYNTNQNNALLNNNVALQNYGLKQDQYANRMNRLAGLIDVGRGTGSALGSLGQGYASNTANILMNNANAGASATLAGNQGLNNLLSQGIGAAALMYGGGFGGGGGGGGGYGASGASWLQPVNFQSPF